MFSILYELERKMISERTKARLQRARTEGKQIGRRPKLSEREMKELIELYEEGIPVTRIARRFGISRCTVYRYLKKCGIFREGRRG